MCMKMYATHKIRGLKKRLGLYSIKIMSQETESVSSIEDLNKLIDEKSKNQEPPFWQIALYVIVSTILPPIGLFLAWKNKILPYVLPLLVSFFSLLLPILIFQQNSSLQVITLLNEVHDSSPKTDLAFQIIIVVAVITSILGLVSGIYLRSKVRKNHMLNKKSIYFLLIIFLIELFLLFYVNGYVQSQIRTQVDSFREFQSK